MFAWIMEAESMRCDELRDTQELGREYARDDRKAQNERQFHRNVRQATAKADELMQRIHGPGSRERVAN